VNESTLMKQQCIKKYAGLKQTMVSPLIKMASYGTVIFQHYGAHSDFVLTSIDGVCGAPCRGRNESCDIRYDLTKRMNSGLRIQLQLNGINNRKQ